MTGERDIESEIAEVLAGNAELIEPMRRYARPTPEEWAADVLALANEDDTDA